MKTALINRRSFLRRAIRGAAGGLYLSNSTARGSISTKRKLSKIGVQLYTVRKELEADFESTLAKVAALGFIEVEFAGYFNHRPQQIREVLARNHLSAPSAHVTTSMLRSNLQQTIEAAAIIGHRYVICGYLPAEERRSLDDYKRLIELFNHAGEQFSKAGLQFGYHNHDFEFVPIEGQYPYDLILAGTSPQTVKMEMDLYWITKAGQSPLRYFSKYPGRFPLVHVKDMDGTSKRFFTEVGRGVIDFRQIFTAARQAGIEHYFVEQDETPGSPFASLKMSMDYLKRLKF
ncbi:MAG TPA: sugar phosphate isomerase/epimerase [Pyrinomonadaceae bacterium]